MTLMLLDTPSRRTMRALALLHYAPSRRSSFPSSRVTTVKVILRPLDYGIATQGNQSFTVYKASVVYLNRISAVDYTHYRP